MDRNIPAWLLDYSARHVYRRGYLTRVRTIHFARWVFLDDRKRLFFASNYDGSLESYMDDFINKVSWGINLVFSNGVGYPSTDWLIKRGARDEQAYKRVLHRHQLPTDVWYKAYPGLTVGDLNRNTRIRQGVERGGSATQRPGNGCGFSEGGAGVAAQRPASTSPTSRAIVRSATVSSPRPASCCCRSPIAPPRSAGCRARR